MTNIRQIAQVTKDGNQYTFINLKIVADDESAGKNVTAIKTVGQQFTNVNDLFVAIRDETLNVITSGLV